MKFVFIFIALGLFVMAYPSCALAQNWNGQNNYQAPNNAYEQQSQFRNQYSGQMENPYGQNQYHNQMQGHYSQQNSQMYQGQAQQYQTNPNMSSTSGGYSQTQNQGSSNQGSFAGQLRPGSYIDRSNQTNSLSGTATQTGSSGDKGSFLKGAAGGIGTMLGKSMKVAAPVAGTVAGNYMLNKAAQRTGFGYYQPNPYGYPYGVNPYGNPYGYGTAYGNPYGAVNPNRYGGGYYPPQQSIGGYYPPQQSIGNSILNTGLRALFGNGY